MKSFCDDGAFYYYVDKKWGWGSVESPRGSCDKEYIVCKISIFVHSRRMGGQNWVKFVPRNWWMPPYSNPGKMDTSIGSLVSNLLTSWTAASWWKQRFKAAKFRTLDSSNLIFHTNSFNLNLPSWWISDKICIKCIIQTKTVLMGVPKKRKKKDCVLTLHILSQNICKQDTVIWPNE